MGNDIARQFAHLPPAEAAEADRPAHRDLLGPAHAPRPRGARGRPATTRLDPLLVDAAGRLAAARHPLGARAEAVARHIETFWDPRMRLRLEALVAAHDDTLDPVLVDAAGRLAAHASRSEPDAQP